MADPTPLGEKIATDEKFRDQLSGAIVNEINEIRISDEISKLGIQDTCFSNAVEQIDNVREFVGSPEHILGNPMTKHGEIAEQVEVGVRRAQQAFVGKEMTSTFERVGRIAPEDYLIDGFAVQSKFLNGTNNNLSAVIEHMDKYSNFGRDGSYYHIPKDEFGIIERIRNNDSVDGLRIKTIETIKEKISLIEEESGRQFSEVVKPGVSKYAEVQQGAVHKTLDRYENDIAKQNTIRKEQVSHEHQASFSEAGKVAGISGAVGVAVSLTTALYQKSKNGKRFYKGDFSADDWKDVGITSVKGGVVGAISGTAIYGLTNYASLSAPFAGSVVSATKGVNSLINDWNKGKINQAEFIELGMVICSESAIVGFATAAGQAAIPIPVLGAIIGSVAGSMLSNFLGTKNKKTARLIRAEIDDYLDKLGNAYKNLVADITAEFEKLGELTIIAFDLEINKKLLESSIELANAYGVQKSKIIKSTSELDAFMLK